VIPSECGGIDDTDSAVAKGDERVREDNKPEDGKKQETKNKQTNKDESQRRSPWIIGAPRAVCCGAVASLLCSASNRTQRFTNAIFVPLLILPVGSLMMVNAHS
jgi:hypothetical protein